MQKNLFARTKSQTKQEEKPSPEEVLIEESQISLHSFQTENTNDPTKRSGIRGELSYFNAKGMRYENFYIISGSGPAAGIPTDTEMINDIVSIFEQNYDRKSLILKIPEAFKHVKGADVHFECVESGTLQ